MITNFTTWIYIRIVSGSVNRENMLFWSECCLNGKPLHSSVTVWCGIWTVGIIGPLSSEDEYGRTVTVISDQYVHMLTHFVFPASWNLVLDRATAYFQKGGATAHTAHQSMNQLNVLQHQIISRFGAIHSPAWSLDLSPCAFICGVS
jgi:hypothetical protein